MLIPSCIELNEEQSRKVDVFYNLLARGKEFYYHPFPDTLYADLNKTLTDSHLAMCMLRNLDEEIGREAGTIMKTDRSKRSKVTSIAKLVKGKTLAELIDASTRAVDKVNVPDYIVEEIKRLKPSRFRIWTDTPRETADIYVRKKIDPLYNCDGKIETIIIHATDLQNNDGILTGEINFLPDEYFRHNIQHLEYLNALKKIRSRIV